MSLFQQYFREIQSLLSEVERDEATNIRHAAKQIAAALEKGGIVHLFGCGHSHILGEELFYRAGGLVPVNPIFIEDLMLHKGAVRSSQLERTSGIAAHFMEDVDIQRNDVFFIVSTSGRNPVPIEVAQMAKERGAFTIAITSPRYAKHQASRHPDGLFLYEVVDLVIDNHAPIGDSLLHEEAFHLSFGPSSTVIGSTIINGISAEAINIMIQNGTTPPIFKSGNVDGADEFNKQLIEKYKKRMPHL